VASQSALQRSDHLRKVAVIEREALIRENKRFAKIVKEETASTNKLQTANASANDEVRKARDLHGVFTADLRMRLVARINTFIYDICDMISCCVCRSIVRRLYRRTPHAVSSAYFAGHVVMSCRDVFPFTRNCVAFFFRRPAHAVSSA
jgi:hypothetical protein